MGGHEDFTELEVADLLRLSSAATVELQRRGVLRTGNAPLGDYAEWLALRAFGGTLAPNSEKSYDLLSEDGRRIQVKARRVDTPPRRGQLQSSPFRSWGFDEALLVLVDAQSYEMRRASLVPARALEVAARFSPHVNGHFVMMDERVMGHDDALDVSEVFREAATQRVDGQPRRLTRTRSSDSSWRIDRSHNVGTVVGLTASGAAVPTGARRRG